MERHLFVGRNPSLKLADDFNKNVKIHNADTIITIHELTSKNFENGTEERFFSREGFGWILSWK